MAGRKGNGAVAPSDRGQGAIVSATISLPGRLATEISKPKDHQAFQRNCVLLFQAELDDPHAQEYGRNGQKQRGIDVLGRRDRNPDHHVGVQCRLIVSPLKQAKILDDCRAALELEARLKEIIFATTAPDDTGATDAALAVERQLRSEGHELRVVIYGWGQLQILIARHPEAYAAFNPSALASTAPLEVTLAPSSMDQFAAVIAAKVVDLQQQNAVAPAPRETVPAGTAVEDPVLHARIDTYRDLFQNDQSPLVAEKGLMGLLEKVPLADKPWAWFRIETNLGLIALDLGREADCVARLEAAHAIRPDDANAIANLALARTIQGRYDEAMNLARQAMAATPRADHAVTGLLQAAARSDWQGEPETLVPPELAGSRHADLGIVEFLRRRDVPGWAQRSLDICRRHPEVPEFRRGAAVAILALVLEAGGIGSDGHGPVTPEELERAADDMKAAAEHSLAVGFADLHDVVAYLNNAAVLLRLCGRHDECVALLQRGLPRAQGEPHLRRLLALALVALDRPDAALAALAGDNDPENCLLRAELTATRDRSEALRLVCAIDPTGLPAPIARIRLHLMGEFAMEEGDAAIVQDAIDGMRALDPADVMADLLEVRRDQKAGLAEAEQQERLRRVADAVPEDAPMMTRYPVADALLRQGLPDAAATLLEGRVGLTRVNPAAILYLQALAGARRDEAFLKAMAGAAPEFGAAPELLWTMAVHAWEMADLSAAEKAVGALLAQQPDHPRGRLLKIEILVRLDRSAELLAELDKPIERLAWRRSTDQFRIADLLGHFGYVERATALAYHLFLEHRDQQRAWMTLSRLVLEDGRSAGGSSRRWQAPAVAADIAIDLRYDDGGERFLVVEPDAGLRGHDAQALEPSHALVRVLMGQAKEARFTDPTGRQGTIVELRHKYVARLHHIMNDYEARFPEIAGFRRLAVDPHRADGLDELIGELRDQREWVTQEQKQYRDNPWPIGLLAQRVGHDPIDVAAGLAEQGLPLKVAIGNQPEREAAVQAIGANAGKGCVLDLLAFWTAWRLEALDIVAAIGGPIHLPRSVLDRLLARRERLDRATGDGLQSARYEDGKLALHTVAPEAIQEMRDDADRAIAWAHAHATICPLIAGEDLPPALRQQIQAGQDDVFDALAVSVQNGLLLVSDDLPTRRFSHLSSGAGGTWSHQLFAVALDRGVIEFDRFVQWSAHLIDAGHSYIGVDDVALASAIRQDAAAGKAPGYLFTALAKAVGGAMADARSHARVAVGFLWGLWSDHETVGYRQPATSILLRQLTRERPDDCGLMLRPLLRAAERNRPDLAAYIRGWAVGHFLTDALQPPVAAAG